MFCRGTSVRLWPLFLPSCVAAQQGPPTVTEAMPGPRVWLLSGAAIAGTPQKTLCPLPGLERNWVVMQQPGLEPSRSGVMTLGVALVTGTGGLASWEQAGLGQVIQTLGQEHQ